MEHDRAERPALPRLELRAALARVIVVEPVPVVKSLADRGQAAVLRDAWPGPQFAWIAHAAGLEEHAGAVVALAEQRQLARLGRRPEFAGGVVEPERHGEFSASASSRSKASTPIAWIVLSRWAARILRRRPSSGSTWINTPRLPALALARGFGLCERRAVRLFERTTGLQRRASDLPLLEVDAG